MLDGSAAAPDYGDGDGVRQAMANGEAADGVLSAGAAATELVADGVTSVSVRRGLAKIEFYRVAGMTSDGRAEVRVPVLRIALPVAGLQELTVALRRLSDAATTKRTENG